MKFAKYLLILGFLFVLSACNSSLSVPGTGTEQAEVTQTPAVVFSPAPSLTATPAPTPTIILQSQYGHIESLAGDRLIFNDNLNPGILTITNKDLSDPVSLGGDIPGYKYIQSVSPDGKWIVFFANQQRSGMQCDENNLYVTNSTGTFLQNVQASVCPNATDFHDISWNEDNLKHAFPCNEDAQERSGICLITISEDKIDLTHVAKNAGMFTTSPDHKSLVYSQTDDGQICLFTAVYDTAQSQKRYCGAKALLFLSWLSDNQSIVGIAADKMMRSENGDLLLFDFKTTEPKVLLSFTGTDDSYLTLSPDRSQIVFCASQPIGTPSVLYMYDLNVDQAYKIENTSLIYTDDTTCNNGWFTFTDQNTLLFQTDYNRDKVHSYKLDFINGSISE